MEIKLVFDTTGRFTVDKSEDLGNFMAIGMLELAKKILLEPKSNEDEEIEGQLELKEEVDEVQ